MASFTAFLEVGGKRYPLFRFEFEVHQETDMLGRPASPVLGGTITFTLSLLGQQEPFLTQWMLSPTMQHDGRVVLINPESNSTLKTIRFFNAYCTNLDLTFRPGQSGGVGSSLVQLQISPQRVAVGAIVHDNNWPVESHGSGETFAKQELPAQQQEPGWVSDVAHTVLDIAGLIPGIGELADGANALFYFAEGNKTDAALSVAAMVPFAGWAATGGKLLRKGARSMRNVQSLRKLKQRTTKGLTLFHQGLEGVEKASNELIEKIASKRQVVIAKKGTDDYAYLIWMDAEANVGGEAMNHILLKEDPSKAAVLEEFLHGTQHKLGMIRADTDIPFAEWHVKDFMVRHRKLLGLGQNDVRILETLRDRDLATYKRSQQQ